MSANITFGSTDAGLVPRQLADIQRAMNEALALIVDPRTGEKPFQNATDDTILQQVVAIFAEAVSNVENAAAITNRQRDPLTATGAMLSALVQLNAILRKAGAPTIIPLTLTGTPSTLVPAGSVVSTADNLYAFAINADVVIPQSGTAPAIGICTTETDADPDPGTVVVIQTPVSGWDSTTNGVTVSVGSTEETDAKLRARQQLSTNATSYRQIEAVRAAVANVEGVSFVRAYQNSGLETDERGIPGKSIACVVVGGDDADIADAIFFRVPIGIGYYGNVSKTIYDDMGMGTAVQFSRPTERLVSVRIQMSVVVDEGIQVFPSNGVDLIKKAILDFAANGHSLCEPLGNAGFVPGQDIVRSYLYTPVNSIGGARVQSIELAVDGGSFSQNDIAIAWDEIGIFSENRIEVDLP